LLIASAVSVSARNSETAKSPPLKSRTSVPSSPELGAVKPRLLASTSLFLLKESNSLETLKSQVSPIKGKPRSKGTLNDDEQNARLLSFSRSYSENSLRFPKPKPTPRHLPTFIIIRYHPTESDTEQFLLDLLTFREFQMEGYIMENRNMVVCFLCVKEVGSIQLSQELLNFCFISLNVADASKMRFKGATIDSKLTLEVIFFYIRK
jgi:hypothetical protein